MKSAEFIHRDACPKDKATMTKLRSDIPLLIVEDSMVMRQMIQNILADLGYNNISVAPNGAVALEKIKESQRLGTPYQMVFLDWGMPEMDGLLFLKTCRAHRDLDRMAIIMLTAVSDKNCMISALENGATAYITKPFTPEDVAEKIEQVSEWIKNNGM